jgi:hypothetical protein
MSRRIATSEVSQFEGNDNSHFIDMARFHMNHGELRIGVVQVDNCELPKAFSDPPIGDKAPVRNSIEEGCSRAGCSLPNFVIKCADFLW